MPKLSSVPLEKKKIEIVLDDFWEAISSLRSKKEIESFFLDLLTHTERKMLAKRFQIAVMLLEGLDYPTIRSSLQVTDNTIAKINNWLKTGATGLAKVAQRLIKEEEDYVGKGGRDGRYLVGDLLMPAVEVGIDVAARQLKKYRKKKRRKLLRQ